MAVMGRFHRPAASVVAAIAALASAALGASAQARPAHHKKHAVARERAVAATRGGLPNVQAQGALVVDEAGRTVFAKNADKERPIASISKLAATLVVAEKGVELEGLS